MSKTLGLIVVFWATTAVSGSAQQNKAIRVCVNLQIARLQGQISPSQRYHPALLHMQTNALSIHKPDKTRHFVLESVAVPELGEVPSGIPGRSPDEKFGDYLTDEDLKTAQAKGCEYVLFSLLSDTWAAMGGGPHTSFPTLQQSLGVPFRTQVPEADVLVRYRLHALNPRAPVIEGSVVAHDPAPVVAVTTALTLVANQVFERIAQLVPAPKTP